jgi:spermidine/putrescine transport system substrate-binding protein
MQNEKLKMQNGRVRKAILRGSFYILHFAFCIALAACDVGTSQPATLHYFTWSDYVGPEIIEEFERKHRVRVVVDTFGSNEELLAKLQTGAAGYDVAVPSDFMVPIMRELGLLAELDAGQIPNAGKLEPRLAHLPFDPEHHVSVPYLWGTVGIGYDVDRAVPAPDSWAALWEPRYRGRISMLNDQREVLGAALRSIGQSLNSTDPGAVRAAADKLLSQKTLVRTYTSDHYDQLLAGGDVWLAHGWGGAVARAMAERPSIRYVIPKEGATIWADCLVILRDSPHQALAHQFINFLLESRIAARTTERLLFASANGEVRAMVSEAVRTNPAVYPPDEAFARLEWMHDVGDAVRLYDRAWTELKMH